MESIDESPSLDTFLASASAVVLASEISPWLLASDWERPSWTISVADSLALEIISEASDSALETVFLASFSAVLMARSTSAHFQHLRCTGDHCGVYDGNLVTITVSTGGCAERRLGNPPNTGHIAGVTWTARG